MTDLFEGTPAAPPRKPPSHTCHWPGCDRAVPPALWGCKGHWFALPWALRRLIWKTYVAGQEITKTPSAAYIEAAKKVQAWIKDEIEKGRAKAGPL